MLQVAERSTGLKRKALLVRETNEDYLEMDAFAPKQFLGEAFDRMRADPEVAKASRRLSLGIAAVMSLILMATVWSVLASWGAPAQAEATAATEPILVKKIEQPALKPQHLPPMLSRPLDFEEIVKARKSELAERVAGSSGE
ncbi:hypothetical protein GCM10023213_01770 [Prosthecobacter algae]|uniref:Uncharacterized protein n=2 Tax=Prosthecobacter algae TaxID=1144682 RepID=A0ABP9NRZ8_9BACT